MAIDHRLGRRWETPLLKLKSKSLFLSLSLLSLLVWGILVGLFWYLISPRLSEIHHYLPVAVGLVLGSSLLLLWGGFILIVVSALSEKDYLLPYGNRQITVPLLFPIAVAIGRILGIPKDELRKSFIEVNNSLVRAMRWRVDSRRLLLLLPQCLQNSACPHKVTINIRNCRGCGKCLLAELIKMGKAYGAELAVATGGTVARRVIGETHPTGIIAVACERDLLNGIQDSYPIPVLGILNNRPRDPCRDTDVDLNLVEEAFQFFNHRR